jgi:hypothetical protein
MVTHVGDSSGRHQRGKPGHEFHGRHDPVGAAAAHRLDPVADAPVPQHLDAIEREGRPGAVAHESLSPLVVAGGDADCTVDVEAVAARREAALLPVEVGVSIVSILPLLLWPSEERAAGEGELGAGFDRGGLGGLVAPVLCRAPVDVPLAPEPPHRPVADAARHLGDIVGARGRDLVEAHPSLVGLLEDAVGRERVQMRMDIERAPEEPSRLPYRALPSVRR